MEASTSAPASPVPRHSPLVQGSQATYRYFGDAQDVRWVADSADNRPVPMRYDGQSWVLTRSYPDDARDEYCYLVDGAWVLDPLNPLQGGGPFGPRSACPMPAYRPPFPIESPVQGKLEQQVLAGRAATVYVPRRVQGAALLVVHDGSDYVRFTGMPGLLDALIREGVIMPTLAVFVDPRDREREYRPNDEYVTWLADDLLPHVSRRYPIHPSPARHGLVGASLGGSLSTYGALTRPDAFRLVGAQSPGYRLAAHRAGVLGARGKIDYSTLRVHIDGGTFEMMLHGREFLPAIRRGAQLLRARGGQVQYVEANEGHNWTNWRGRLPGLLAWLLSPVA